MVSSVTQTNGILTTPIVPVVEKVVTPPHISPTEEEFHENLLGLFSPEITTGSSRTTVRYFIWWILFVFKMFNAIFISKRQSVKTEFCSKNVF
jgi:hypothetical protein